MMTYGPYIDSFKPINLEWQKISEEIWQRKYKYTPTCGAGDSTVWSTFSRVANALACDRIPAEEIEVLLKGGCLPAGRVIANAGTYQGSLINCTVSGKIPDSIEGIFTAVLKGAQTLKAGCGIGYCFSTIRPNGATIGNSATIKTTGALPFMDTFDAMCKTIACAGGRRGAQMGTMHCWHPDIQEFIKAKREPGKLRNFNLSVLITDDFIHAVKNDLDWNLEFDDEIYDVIKARDLWKQIIDSNYQFAEPGAIFIDTINNENVLNGIEHITATNPCGEQPLPPNGACLLGSINLTNFLEYDGSLVNPKPNLKPRWWFNWKRLYESAYKFHLVLDLVVDQNYLPLQEQRDQIECTRRHGLGFMGLGSVLNILGIRYGSREAIEFTESVSASIMTAGIEAGQTLPPAPCFSDIEPNTLVWERTLERAKNDPHIAPYATTDLKLPKVLHWSHCTSIAPTGTTALSFGNNASNGIEPTYLLEYLRNVLNPDGEGKTQSSVFSYERWLYKQMSLPEPGNWVTTDDLTIEDHLKMQAAAQKYVDGSISKTINVPSATSRESFENIYLTAHELGLKGCTTYRFNPDSGLGMGVLVKPEDQAALKYKIKLADGREVIINGSDKVMYQGKQYIVANLIAELREKKWE